MDTAKPGRRSVCAGLWQGAKVAIKFVVSDSLNSNSVTLRESLLGQLLSHPNVSSHMQGQTMLLPSIGS